MKKIILLLVALFSTSIYSQSLNQGLKKSLDSILFLDQAPRALMQQGIAEDRKKELLEKIGYTEEEFNSNPYGIMAKIDSTNQRMVFKIIAEHGYPGKSLVGEPTNRTAWSVIQHSDKIEEYLPLIKKAGKEGELSMKLAAMMEDRYLMHSGKEQIYGTQVYGGNIKDPETGEETWKYIVWPIKDEKSVNERRNSIGYDSTVEEYAKKLDLEYRVFTLEEAKEMFGM